MDRTKVRSKSSERPGRRFENYLFNMVDRRQRRRKNARRQIVKTQDDDALLNTAACLFPESPNIIKQTPDQSPFPSTRYEKDVKDMVLATLHRAPKSRPITGRKIIYNR